MLPNLAEIDLNSITPEDITAIQQQISDPVDTSFSVWRTATQIVTGWIQGFTAIPVGEKPHNVYEAIAHNIGELAGFIGVLFPGLGASESASRGLSALSTWLRSSETLAALRSKEETGFLYKISEGLANTAKVVAKFRSVPMTGADLVTNAFRGSSLEKSLEAKLADHPVVQQAIYEGMHLGIASSISSLYEGLDHAVKSGLYGAIFGGVFTGIGNLPFAKESTTSNTVLKAIAGSLVQGLPATIAGYDTATQVYDYLLGAYFGAHSTDSDTFKAMKFVSGLKDKNKALSILRMDPTQTLYPFQEEFAKQTPEVQKKIKEIIDDLYKPKETAQALYDIFKGLLKKQGVDDAQAEALLRSGFELGKQIIKPEDWVKIQGDDNTYRVISITSDTATLDGLKDPVDVKKLVRVNVDTSDEKNSIDSKFSLETLSDLVTPNNILQYFEDYDANSINLNSAIKRFVMDVTNNIDNLNSEKINLLEKYLNDKIQTTIANGEGWKSFEDYAKTQVKAVTGNDIQDETLGLLKQHYLRSTQSVPIVHYRYDEATSKLLPDTPIEGDPNYIYDVDNNRVDARIPKNILHILTNDDDVMRVVDYVASKGNKLKRKLKFSLYDLEDKHFASMNKDAMKEGYYLFSGAADKPKFYLLKFNTGDNLEAEFNRVLDAFRVVEPKTDKIYWDTKEEFVKNGWGTEEDFKKIIVSNARYLELLNNRSINYLLPAGKVKDIPEHIINLLKKNYEAHREEFSSKGIQMYTQAQKASQGGSIEARGVDFIHPYQKILHNQEVTKEELMQIPGIGEKYAEQILNAKIVIKKNKGFINNLINFNKRLQIIFNTFNTLDRNIWETVADKYKVRDHGLKYILVKDFKSVDNNAETEWSDGAVIVDDNVLAAHAEAFGISPETGFMKSFYTDPTYGLMLGKLAEHGAGEEQSKLMRKYGFGNMIFESAAKQIGDREVYTVKYNGKDFEFYLGKKKIDPKDLKVYTMQPEDYHASFGIYDNAYKKINKPTRLARSVLNILTPEQVGKDAIKALQSHLEQFFSGNKKVNETLREYLIHPDESKLEYLKEHFDEIGVKELSEALTHPNAKEFREMATTKMIAESINFDPKTGQEVEVVEHSDLANLDDELNGALRIIKIMGGADAVSSIKQAQSYIDGHLMHYFIRRITSPKLPNSGKAVMRAYDWSLQNAIKVEEDKFYLDNIWKKLKVDGVTLNGEEKRMTLEELWNNYKKISEEKGFEETKRKMREKLRALVYRVPIDDVPGMASLEFGGFTGRKGGGILLHAKTMRRLGGADLDIDSASFFFGLPKEFHEGIAKNTKPFYENDTYKSSPDIEKALLREVPKVPSEGSIFAMIDPRARATIAHAVSKGRGSLMGSTTMIRFFTHTLYSNANSRPDKTLELTATDRDGRLAGYKIRLTARDDNGEMLRTISAIALNTAADLGKYGAMATAEEIRAAELVAAFKRIEVVPKTGKRIVLYDNETPLEVIKNIDKYPKLLSLVSFRKERFDGITPSIFKKRMIAEKKKTGKNIKYTLEKLKEIQKRFQEYISRTILIDNKVASIFDTELGDLREVDSRLFRRNRTVNRPWTQQEVSESIYRYPENIDSVLRWVSSQVYGLGKRVTPLDILMSAPNRIKDFYGRVNQAIRDLEETKEFQPLTRKVFITFKGLQRIIDGITRYYSPNIPFEHNKLNLAYARGRELWANDIGNFYQYIVDQIIEPGSDIRVDPYKFGEKFLRYIGADTPVDAGAAYDLMKKEFGNIDEEKFIRAYNSFSRQRSLRVNNYIWRLNFINAELRKANDFFSNALRTISGLKTQLQLYQKSRLGEIPPIDTGDGKQVRLEHAINGLVKQLKEKYTQYWNHRGSGKVTYNDILQQIADDISFLNKTVEKFNAENRFNGIPIKLNNVLDYYYGSLLSNITFQPLKNSPEFYELEAHKLAFDVVPSRLLYLFGRNHKELYDRVADKDSYFSTRDIKDYFTEKLDQADLEKRLLTYDYHKNIFFANEKIKLDPKMRHLVNRIVDIASTYRPFVDNPELLFAVMRKMYGVAQPSDMTIHQLRGFANMLERWKTGPGFINWLLKKDPDKLPFEIHHGFQFMKTTADEMRKKDLILIHDKVFKNGKLNPNAPVLTHVEPDGRIRKVYGDAATPITHLHRLVYHAEKASQLYEQVYQQHTLPKLSKYFRLWFERRIENIEQPHRSVDDSEKILHTAWYFRELSGIEQTIRIAKEEGVSEGKIKRLYAKRKKLLNDPDFVKVREEYNKNIHYSKYKIIEPNGETKIVDGSELLARARDSYAKVFDEMGADKIYISDRLLEKIPVDKDNLEIKLAPLFQQILDMFAGNKLSEPVSYDWVRFVIHENKIEDTANEVVKTINTLPSIKDIENITWKHHPLYDVLTEDGTALHNLVKERIAGKDRFIAFNSFLLGVQDPSNIDQLIFETKHIINKRGKPIELMYLSPKQTARIHGLELAKKYYENENMVNDAKILREYYGKPINKKSVLGKLFGIGSYSQYQQDIALASRKITPKAWLKRSIRFYFDPFKETGQIAGYMPHMWLDKSAVNKLKQEIKSRAINANDQQFEVLVNLYNRLVGTSISPDMLLNQKQANDIITEEELPKSVRQLRQLEPDKVVSNMLSRINDLSGYNTDLSVIEKYFEGLDRGTYQALGNLLMKQTIDHFVKSEVAGEHTQDWAKWMRIYARGVMGYPSLFDDEILKGGTFGRVIKKTPYYWLSDHAFYNLFQKYGLNKLFVRATGDHKLSMIELMALERKLGRKPTKAEVDAAEGRKVQFLANTSWQNKEAFAYKLKTLANVEARFELASLLASVKTGVANVLFGNVNTWVWNGGKYMKAARDLSTWKKLGWKYNGRPVETMEDVYRTVASWGVMEDWIVHGFNITSPMYKEGKYNDFFKSLIDLLKKDPLVEDETVFSLAKKYGIEDSFMDKAAAIMRKTERYLRINSFLSGYLAARASMEPMALEYDNLYLIEQGKRSVEFSQFLYDAPHKPAFAATSLGQVYSRFKLWAWQSVMFRRHIYEEASNVGFSPESPEFDRLKRAAIADLFMFGMAMLLPYTIFDYGLPSPYNWFQSLADWIFGDDKKRERAFFISSFGLPTALAPLSELLPPIARLPKGIYDGFRFIWGGDTEKLSSYTVYTLFPFGRMAHDVYRAINNPSMAFDFLTGIPLHRIGRVKKQLNW